jgi:hypothetical protein
VYVPDDVNSCKFGPPEIDVQIGAAPVPAEVKTSPLLPATLVRVNAVVKLADASVAPVMVGLVANTFEPVPVFVTLTRFLDASVATALEAVKPAMLASVPT